MGTCAPQQSLLMNSRLQKIDRPLYMAKCEEAVAGPYLILKRYLDGTIRIKGKKFYPNDGLVLHGTMYGLIQTGILSEKAILPCGAVTFELNIFTTKRRCRYENDGDVLCCGCALRMHNEAA